MRVLATASEPSFFYNSAACENGKRVKSAVREIKTNRRFIQD